jgi:hypothetical protein
MPRGKVGCIYTSDGGDQWAVNVDADYAATVSRGWTQLAEGASLPLAPRGAKLRRVYGVDAAGFRGSAVVGSTTASLWTGGTTQFNIEGSDVAAHTMVVTGRVGEKVRLAHGAVPGT